MLMCQTSEEPQVFLSSSVTNQGPWTLINRNWAQVRNSGKALLGLILQQEGVKTSDLPLGQRGGLCGLSATLMILCASSSWVLAFLFLTVHDFPQPCVHSYFYSLIVSLYCYWRSHLSRCKHSSKGSPVPAHSKSCSPETKVPFPLLLALLQRWNHNWLLTNYMI